MDIVFSWYRVLEQNSWQILPNLILECLVRAALLLSVILMHLKFQPQPFAITAEEMLNIYKKPRKDSYVPPWAMILSVLFMPLIIFSLPLLLLRDYVETVEALLGWTLTLLVNANCTELLKLLVLRPRPDFFYRCFPCGIESENCVANVQDVIEGRKSFPSGHTSFAFCSLGFLSLWLEGKLAVACRSVRAATFSCLPLALATVIGASRCCDNHHHWEDVVAGAIIGLVSSYVCYRSYCKAKPVNHNINLIS